MLEPRENLDMMVFLEMMVSRGKLVNSELTVVRETLVHLENPVKQVMSKEIKDNPDLKEKQAQLEESEKKENRVLRENLVLMSPVPKVKLAWKEKKDLMEKMEPQEIREVSDQRVDKVPLEMPVLLESQETMELLETKDPMV